MSTLTLRCDAGVGSCEGPGDYVKVPFDEGGDFYLYLKDGAVVVGDSPPERNEPAPPKAKKNAKAKAGK